MCTHLRLGHTHRRDALGRLARTVRAADACEDEGEGRAGEAEGGCPWRAHLYAADAVVCHDHPSTWQSVMGGASEEEARAATSIAVELTVARGRGGEEGARGRTGCA